MTAERDSLLPAEDNRRMFDRIARRYDLLNRCLSLGMDRSWRRRAVAALAPRAGATYLDVGCGTGDVALEALRQAPGARVVGIDPATAMLDIAAAKVREACLATWISLQAGDATALAFADASVDGVISAFCLRNITRRARALGEMRRVLRPGGRVVILELTSAESAVVRLAQRVYNRFVVAGLGRLLSDRGAYRYLGDSIADFPAAEETRAQLVSAGFSHTQSIPLAAGVVTLFVGEAE